MENKNIKTEAEIRAAEARKAYDKENMAMLATKLRKEDAEAFSNIAAERGTTVSRMLSDYVKSVNSAGPVKEANPTGTNVAVLTYENVERLKHEVAFHNPDHLNPDEMLNDILNGYFTFVERVRFSTHKRK